MQASNANAALARMGPLVVNGDLRRLKQEIEERLGLLGIDYRHWGSFKHSKSLDELVEFLANGEIIWDGLTDTHDLPVAVGYVRCVRDGKLLELRDVKQSFANGYRHTRTQEMFSGTFGEKIKTAKGETRQAAVRRGVGEELGQDQPGFWDPDKYSLLFLEKRLKGPEPSEYFPALEPGNGGPCKKTVYHRNLFRIFIGPELYLDEYVLREKQKTTVFQWFDIEPDWVERYAS